MKLPRFLCAAAFMLITSAGFGAEAPGAGSTVKEYPIRDLGTLSLSVPGGWQAAFNKTIQAGTYVEELTFQPRGTNDCVIFVSVIHMLDAVKIRDFDTHKACLDGAKPELRTATEKTPETHDFKGAETSGSYLSLTDSTVPVVNAKPGEYKHLTLGYAKLGLTILAFRVVSNRPGPEDTDAGVALIKSARLTGAK